MHDVMPANTLLFIILLIAVWSKSPDGVNLVDILLTFPDEKELLGELP